MWGEMARLTAITPKVFVSNTSLITSSEVTSCAPNKPIAALFTTASIFPNRSIPFAIALEMLLRLRDVEGRDQQLIPVVERIVAITFQSRARKCAAVGSMGVRYPAFKQPSFALVLKGSCLLTVEGMPATTLETGDFVLFPAMPEFILRSDPEVRPRLMKPAPSEEQVEEVFHGDGSVEPSVSMLGGYFAFDRINASMLLNFLPKILRLRASDPAIDSVAVVVELIQREARERRAGRTLVLTRLIEVMLVEAFAIRSR
jgi:hypothetical protein